ncbi:3'-5' exonuclease [Thalassobacillus hwangdonensis]|uniref:PolC-type DNA polymerase III n=1 Tax=Thalassobacillus hwangdonensis TaxID=546108 RepID=A0ABW3KXP6_9BACI
MLPIDLQILKYIFFEKPIYHYKIKPFLKWDSYHQLTETLEQYETNPDLLKKPLTETPFTIFDLETTGFIPEIGHEIISIGAIRISGFQHCRVKRLHQIIRPIRPVGKETLRLTGLTRSDIDNASSFIHGFQQFYEFSKDSILVAHPAKFDMRFVKTMLKRWKLPVYDPPVIDSQLMAQWLLPDKKHQLDPLLRHFKIKKLERHHALNDAIMTAELFENLLRLTQETGIKNYEQLNRRLNRIPDPDPSLDMTNLYGQ